MLKGSRTTLLLFLWVFWIGAGGLSLFEAYQYFASGGALTMWDVVSITLSLLYFVGGLSLVFKLDALLPRYRAVIVRLVTIGFCIGVALNLWGMFWAAQDPSVFDPTTTKEQAILFVIGMGIVTVAFNFLIYKIVINSINAVSNVPAPKQTKTQTIIYWGIVLAFFATMLLAILWDPAAGSFNVL